MNDKEIVELGVVCGRFQVFHNDHLKYVLGAKEVCKHLIVGITSADPSMSPREQSDLNRGKKAANPCTFFERMIIIEQSLLDIGISRSDFHIVPLPIGKPELIKYYLPKNAICFFTIYDAWGHEKVKRINDLGYKTKVLWKSENKGLSSSFIRKLIAEGSDWRAYVPNATYNYFRNNMIDKRIADMINEGEK